MEGIPDVDRDERDRPNEGSDWSIEDFDDFSSFDEFELDPEAEAQSQLEFGMDASDEGDTSDDAAEWHLDDADEADDGSDPATPAAGPVESSDSMNGDDASAEDSFDSPDDAGSPDAIESDSVESEAAAAQVDPEVAERGADLLEPSNTMGLTAPMEPEASMGRPSVAEPTPPTPEDEVFDVEDVPDFASFTQEHYVQATTQEYAGLAEDVARAASEAPPQMAVAADIPGLESGIVGLEDVLDEAPDVDHDVATRRASDLSVRVLTGLALISVFFGSLYQDYLIAILIFVVMLISAVELYVVLVRVGFRPMTLFGLLGVGGALFGTWYWGPIAIPMAMILTTIVTLVFFGVVAHRREPLLDTALTVLVLAWIGTLGALAMDIAWAPDYAWMVAAVVVITALMDVAQYFAGRRFGKRPLAPRVSPKKTIEGLIGGVVVAIGVGIAIGYLGAPFDILDGLILGVIVAIVAPFGDLAVSVVKRAIGVKDMGAILPGHGGVLDRIDAMVFVIPAAWVAYSWMGLIAA